MVEWYYYAIPPAAVALLLAPILVYFACSRRGTPRSAVVAPAPLQAPEAAPVPSAAAQPRAAGGRQRERTSWSLGTAASRAGTPADPLKAPTKPAVELPTVQRGTAAQGKASGQPKGGGGGATGGQKPDAAGAAAAAAPVTLQKKGVQAERLPLAEILLMTRKFDRGNRIGRGSTSDVFLGTGPAGAVVAVKRSVHLPLAPHAEAAAAGKAAAAHHPPNQLSPAGEERLRQLSLRLASHPNLVRLLGYCFEAGERVLVLEHVRGRTLQKALEEGSLPFVQRLAVAERVALALAHLHGPGREAGGGGAEGPAGDIEAGHGRTLERQADFVHQNLHPKNIVLLGQHAVKVGNPGQLKLLLQEGTDEGQRQGETRSTLGLQAPGYVDPEYHLSGRATAAGDVFGFGVILLQLMTGQRAIVDTSRLPEGPREEPGAGNGEGAPPRPTVDKMKSIGTWARPYVQRGVVEPIVDGRLGSRYGLAAVKEVMQLALDCQRMPASKRPAMVTVAKRLGAVLEEERNKMSGVIEIDVQGE